MKTRRCGRGKILRAAYTRRSSRTGTKTRVPEQCIRNVGAPGKGYKGVGPGIGRLQKGELAAYGYENVTSMSTDARHAALRKAIRAFGALTVWRKLNAVHVYTRALAPASSKTFKSDMNWIKETFGLHA
jgi:hypothetical protein